jgi:flagellum-specific peptidoglycan hydrolase FlgJ
MKKLIILLLFISTLSFGQVDGTIVYKELVKIGVKFPEIVLAQAKLETGHFKSVYCNERYNLFGFQTKQGYMYFKSWKHCCQYYKHWQDRHYRYGEDYYSFLKRIGYATDSNYIKKVKACLK